MAKGGSTQQRGRKAAQSPAEARQNGNGSDLLAEAIAHEQQVARDADKAWEGWERRMAGENIQARSALASFPNAEFASFFYSELRPLLRRAIPPGFITSTGVVKGKPYASTGVKSVQVQIDRLDNVLRFCWGYEREFFDGGKRCEVHAWVGMSKAHPLVLRDGVGGVQQASTMGNLYKGSFTNAAKPCFARLGPGWEVYVGAADFDPDTDESAAEQQAKTEAAQEKDPNRPLSAPAVEKLRAAIEKAGLSEHLDVKLRGFGVATLEDLTAEQGVAMYEWADGAKGGE
jgi:hypothetical protein